MIYGYARVSTATQGRDGNSLEDQVAALEKYGCQKIVKEAFTGKTMDRPKFLNLLEVLQEGDTLVVCKLDRFARTAIEGVQVVRELFERGIRVRILNMGLGINGVKYEKIDDKHFTAQAEVEISDMFYAWVAGFGRRAKIIDPPHVVEGMREFAAKVAEMYETK